LPYKHSTVRILYIGHTYIVAENQKKLHALAEQPGVTLALITPHVWREPVLGKNLPHIPANAPFSMRAIRAVWPGAEQYYWCLSLDLGLRHFQPDVLCVEQGAGSFVYAQSLIARNLFAPRAKAAFFTWWNLPYRARWPLREVERFNLSQSQGGVAGNNDAAAILRDHGFTGPLTVLPQLGVDPTEYCRKDASELRRELGLDRFTVGYTGRFVEEKGIRVLLEALAGAEFDFQLLMLGRGPLEDEIRAFAAGCGWGNCLKIISGVGHSDIARYQNCMDVMVVPSLTRPFWKEQFGHVIIEAMACEVPVIGSDSAEVPFVIGEAGLVTPEGDAAALRAALSRLAASPEERRRLGQAGRQRVLNKYTHHEIARRLVEFFWALPSR
jgi:glycosyltransferase involved in cell wall biosynthesis